MEKIKKTTDLPGNIVTEKIRQQMFLENINPGIDLSKKAWNLVKVLKTETNNVPWLIFYDNEYYVAIQSNNRRYGSQGVSFYPSDEKGRYNISLNTQITRLVNYLDMESACDEFIENLNKKKLIKT